MNLTPRALAALLAVLLLLLLGAYWSPSVAQDKPATIAELQSNTPCGAEAIGLNRSTGMPIRYQREGLNVNAQGVWEECSMPKPPAAKPLMQGCVTAEALEWESMGNVCRHRGAIALDHNSGRMINADPGQQNTGGVFYSCRNGRLSRGSISCSPIVWCEGRYRGTDDGGSTWWMWSGRLPKGEMAEASDGAGHTRKILCDSDGKLKLQ